MNRFEELREILKRKRCFKLVCGAGNEDIEEVRRLSIVYTLAGATVLDLSGNIDVVKTAKEGIEKAYEIADILKRDIKVRPFLNVSIGLKGDPHIRKASITPELCTRCTKCIEICREKAIRKDFVIEQYKCVGCGKCEKVCDFDAIKFSYKIVDFSKVLPECLKMGAETMELHAVGGDDESALSDWRLLNNVVRGNFLSMCLDRSCLSDRHIVGRVREAYKITSSRLIIQADGVPMSGENDDYNTTLQAIACADIVQKSGIPVMLLLSGGTNSKTGLLARQCGINANGVSIGSFARKIVREFIRIDDFDSNIELIRKAVSIAEQLIKSNIEALSG